MSHLRPFLLGPVLLLAACGPLVHPMFDRLSPDAQAQVNTAWNNMLSSPNRLDRSTLLGVIVEHQFFELGITRGAFHSEKSLATGTVVMDITYDEPTPANDRFEIRVYDLAWHLQRSETFTREDITAVEQRLQEMNQYLSTAATQPTTQRYIMVPDTSPATAPAMSPEELADWTARHQAALRLRQTLDAATQPAPPPRTPATNP